MSGHFRVLLVEDSPGDAYLVGELLSGESPGVFEVECAPRLATALERLTEDRFDVILLDLGLPDCAGISTVRAMREAAAGLPLVVITGNGDEQTGIAAIQEGAQDYVVKGTTSITSLSRILRYAMERNQSEGRLRESEERFRRVSAITTDIAYSCKTREEGGFSIHWITGAVDCITGYSSEEIKAHGCWRFLVLEEDLALFDENVIGLAPGARSSCELRIRHKNGGIAWIACCTECVSAPQAPGCLFLYGGLREITARKQAEQQLRVALVKYQTLFDSFPLGITVSDSAGKTLESNPMAKKLLDESQEEHNQRRINGEEWRIVRTDGAPMPAEDYASVRALKENRRVENAEMGIVKANGETTWISVTAAPLPLEGHGVVIAYGDVTERKLMEDSLRLTQLSVDRAADLIHWIGPDGRLLYVSDSNCRRHGYSREELTEMTIFDLDPSMSPKAWAKHWRKLKEQGFFTFETVHKTKDGQIFPVEVTTNYVEHNGRECNIAFARDITERQRASEELRQGTVRLERLVGGTVCALSSLAEQRDPYTAGHQLEVSRLSCAIGAQMGLAPQDIEGLRIAALLHDIGKVAVPIEILSKPGAISSGEMEIVKTHPEVGYQILKDLDFARPVGQIVRQHHERMDGSGYPWGTKGADILLEARILAVADVVEATSSHRPYRPALGLKAALAEVSRHRGLFDRKVVRACVTLFDSGAFSLESAWPRQAPSRRGGSSVHSISPPVARKALAKAVSRTTS